MQTARASQADALRQELDMAQADAAQARGHAAELAGKLAQADAQNAELLVRLGHRRRSGSSTGMVVRQPCECADPRHRHDVRVQRDCIRRGIARASKPRRFHLVLRTWPCIKQGGWSGKAQAPCHVLGRSFAMSSGWLARRRQRPKARAAEGERRGRRDKRTRHPGVRKAGLHMGLARHAQDRGTVPSNGDRPHACWRGRVPATRQHATQRQGCMASNG
ncbi:hypothetical protein SAMN04244547_01833 [Azotobacter vinelandii]|nr:hypothetical protein SAMN04244547_01833 [Azotobacter vinelandii]